MFKSARIKLTAWYLLIIMLISLFFTTMIYQASKLELARYERLQRIQIERRFLGRGVIKYPSFYNPELIKETQKRLLFILLSINGGILIISGIASYFLAGKTLKPIREMVEEQNRFISDASHELRTPLTALKTSFEVSLRDKELSLKEAKKLIAEGLKDVNKLQSLVNSLLKLAQFEKPENNYVFGNVSLSSIVAKAVRKIEPLAKQKNIKIFNQINNSFISLKGDEEALTELFLNLLDNAIKYSPMNKKVIISSIKKNNFVFIEFKDEGYGIASKDLPHIFDRFYRADSARSKETTGGYGLGLAIAQKIVQAHKGSIAVKSVLNKGTSFVVKLPIST